MTDPTVFVVDGDDGMRESLKDLMQSVGLNVETFAAAAGFVERYGADEPGCLILGLKLPGISGLELQRELQSSSIRIPVVIVAEQGDVPSAVQAMKNGAFDFLEKPFNDQRLLDCVQTALTQDRARRQAHIYRQSLQDLYNTLTAREKEVMTRVVQGMPNRLIAEDLSVSPKTIEVHRSKVMEKMQAGSLSELINIAVTIGILSEYVDGNRSG